MCTETDQVYGPFGKVENTLIDLRKLNGPLTAEQIITSEDHWNEIYTAIENRCNAIRQEKLPTLFQKDTSLYKLAQSFITACAPAAELNAPTKNNDVFISAQLNQIWENHTAEIAAIVNDSANCENPTVERVAQKLEGRALGPVLGATLVAIHFALEGKFDHNNSDSSDSNTVDSKRIELKTKFTNLLNSALSENSNIEDPYEQFQNLHREVLNSVIAAYPVGKKSEIFRKVQELYAEYPTYGNAMKTLVSVNEIYQTNDRTDAQRVFWQRYFLAYFGISNSNNSDPDLRLQPFGEVVVAAKAEFAEIIAKVFAVNQGAQYLDLGTGTRSGSNETIVAFPHDIFTKLKIIQPDIEWNSFLAQWTLTDASIGSLSTLSAEVDGAGGRVALVDLGRSSIPDSPKDSKKYDAVTASVTIHQLAENEQNELFEKVNDSLEIAGTFHIIDANESVVLQAPIIPFNLADEEGVGVRGKDDFSVAFVDGPNKTALIKVKTNNDGYIYGSAHYIKIRILENMELKTNSTVEEISKNLRIIASNNENIKAKLKILNHTLLQESEP